MNLPDVAHIYRPGWLEVFCGPMKSGKTSELINRVGKLCYQDTISYIVVKPTIDTRYSSEAIVARNKLRLKSVLIPPEEPERLLKVPFTDRHIIAIDEVQFFDARVVPVIQELLARGKNVIVAGLDQDFRGEPFGPMPLLLTLANTVTKVHGICDVKGCSRPGTRTQRLIDGKPAPYESPLILVGGDEIYEVRCDKHHDVPR